ncbi:aspartate aminotransferase [Micractinium conductrix]|uniref:Aspartate aminotransferase n=1 Tax=Micractinium conductrix TaxID=554055 RepID=A0A2P6VLZ3_9CHLO|nr:aspartate aminotransferase [Micractinium conductrix]|eukprot:PSC75103.1 aspartate aminotransferase [Micractinium conductrix]
MQSLSQAVAPPTTAARLTPASGGAARRLPVARPARGSRLEGVEMAPPDPILGVSEAFKRDTSGDKLNLGVGAYRTEELQPFVLNVVRKAEERMLAANENKEYLPIEGLAAFRKATVELLLGADSPAIKEGRIACLQSLSGTGSLRIGAAFIAKFMPGAAAYISRPTWGNHKNIFADAGVEWKEYSYFDPETIGLDFGGMVADLQAAPEGSVVVLHGCAHNPTGVDPTPEQWEQIADVCVAKKLLPFFDVAYQGFATGSLDADAFAPRYFAQRGIEFAVAQSYSKNLGLYAERVGAISFVLSDKEAADRVLSQLKRIARAVYSNPPIHGARIVSEVVGSEEMFAEWKGEMEEMSGRIKAVRQVLFDELNKLEPNKDWSFILKQVGMFSFTGLSPAQCDHMTNKWHVYMTKDGRLSLAGLNKAKCKYLADAPSSNSHTLQLRIDVFDAAALHGAGPEGRARAERTAACCGGAVERSIGFPGVHTPVSGSSAPEPPAYRAFVDFKFVRDNVEAVAANCAARLSCADPQRVATLYEEYVAAQQETDRLRAARNENSGAMKGKLEPEARAALIEKGKGIKEELEGLEARLAALDAELQREGQRLPNMTHPDVPIGGEDVSTQLQLVGQKQSFAFEPKDHLQLGEDLDLIDFETGGVVSGAKFYYLRNEAALLELALVNYTMHKVVAAGFTPMMTPDLVRESVFEKCGFQPRAENTQIYSVKDSAMCLTGTAEIPLGGAYMDAILPAEQLPIRMAAFGHCFRTEAGAAGAASKGLYRVHQFSKVEMFVVCTPEQSDALHQQLLELEVGMYAELGLHFQVLDMASHDLGAPAYRKFDIEAWMPGMGRYGEISSASNCTDYQARRLNIRYRPQPPPAAEGDAAAGAPEGKKGGKKKGGPAKAPTQFAHTLNATACAVPRMIVAILENYQQEDGSVVVPEALRLYMMGIDVIRPKKKINKAA